MSCHNAIPDFVLGSENKFHSIPKGIDCERCHGPGEIHVKQKFAGNIVDTSKYIDYSIVNPSKLPLDLQFDVEHSIKINYSRGAPNIKKGVLVPLPTENLVPSNKHIPGYKIAEFKFDLA